MRQPWAEISQRLRRIPSKFKLMHCSLGSKVNPNAILLRLEFFVRVPNTEADAEDGGEGLDSLVEVSQFS